MARIADPLIRELEHEAATTKRLLERVPEDKLAWQPHKKSMTLGRLAHHVATIPGEIIETIIPLLRTLACNVAMAIR